MHVETAFITDEIKITAREIKTISSPRYPLQSPPFVLIVEILLLPEERGVTHYLEVEIHAPNGQIAAKTPREPFLVGADQIPEHWHVTPPARVVFPIPGAYSFVVFIDGTERKRFPFQAELSSGFGPSA